MSHEEANARETRDRIARLACAAVLLLATACGSAGPPPPSTAEDFYNQGLERLKGSRVFFFFETVDYERAIASFQEVIDNFPFSEYAPLAELEIGDAYLALGRFEQAASFYQDFIELHPSHPKVPYALLRNGRCAFDQMLAPDQDQTKTREAIEQLTALLEKYPDSDLIAEAQELRGEARDRLALHEVNIGDYYYGAEKWTAAVSRYREALTGSPEHPEHQRTRARLGLALRRSGQVAEGNRILEALVAEPIDEELREEIAEAIGGEAARLEPGFRLWPFGDAYPEPEEPEFGPGDDGTRGLPLDALVEPDLKPAPAPAPPTEGADAGESDAESSWLGWLWPFGGGDEVVADADAEQAAPAPEQVALAATGADVPSAGSAAATEPVAPEAEESGSWLGWLWPFGGDAPEADGSAAAIPASGTSVSETQAAREETPAEGTGEEPESGGWFGWLWPFGD